MSTPSINLNGLTAQGALRALSRLFAAAGVTSAEADARLLLGEAAGLDRAAMIRNPESLLDNEAISRLETFARRRLAGEPSTRIIGRRAFWTLDLRVTPDVLDPRPDTETIVEAALEALGARRHDALRVLDLGVGSGALLLALLSECRRATGVGVDLSAAACAIARENAARNGLDDRAIIREGRWTENLNETFDLVLSNPPYIETEVIAGLATEVREHDPILALDGGPDGLAAYRAIIAALRQVLKREGLAVLELGAGQTTSVSALASAAGMKVLAVRPDLGGVERALVLSWSSERR